MYLINVLPIGVIGLLGYIIIDMIRYRTKNLVRRLIFYTFIFYLLNVFELTTGGIYIPPRPAMYRSVTFQWIPFDFLREWVMLSSGRGMDWFFWNSVRLTLYNVVMLFPLGLYLPLVFRVRTVKKVALSAFAVSLTIEIYQVIFSYFGLVLFRTFNVDDLILNTLGAVIGYCLYKGVVDRWFGQWIDKTFQYGH